MTDIKLVEKKDRNGMGQLLRYGILNKEQNCGRLSIVEFTTDKPYAISWTYLMELVVEPKMRGKGIGRQAVDFVNNKIIGVGGNGILINAVLIPEARQMYQKQGWKRVILVPGFEFLIQREISTFYLRKVCDLVEKNFLK